MRYRLPTLTINRPSIRFSLASLFIAVSLICLACGWLVNSGGNQRHRAIVKLQRFGVDMWFEHQGGGTNAYRPNAKPPGTALEKRLFGEYCQTRVIQLEAIPSGKFSDADAKAVAVFQELDWLAINDSEITDEGLRHLEALENLGRLDVQGCRITRQGVERLRGAIPTADVYSDYE